MIATDQKNPLLSFESSRRMYRQNLWCFSEQVSQIFKKFIFYGFPGAAPAAALKAEKRALLDYMFVKGLICRL